ncbi:MAG: hypothetical protein HQK87_06055 [Nitrospinae bacterium]|nr:hypothetical protein [Nitrospinota bacterium]
MLRRPIIALGFALAAAAWPSPARGAWILDAGIDARWEDNLTRSPKAPLADTAMEVDLAAGRYLQVEEYTGLSLVATLHGEKYATYDRLDAVEAGIGATLRRRFGLGPEAWTAAMTLAGGQSSVVDHYRSARFAAAQVSLSRWFAERLSLDVSLAYDTRRPLETPPIDSYATTPSDVYDLSGQSVAVEGGYLVGEEGIVTLRAAYRDGDIVSSVKPTKWVNKAAKAVTDDQAFDQRIAYRIGARTTTLGVGYTHALFTGGSVSAGYEYRSSAADGGLSYTGSILRATLLYSF